MLHTKFRGNRSTGFREEDSLMFLQYIGVVAILVMRPRFHEQTFDHPTDGGSTQNLALIGQTVTEKMIEIVEDDNGRTSDDDGRRSMVYYTLTYEPSGQVS